MAAFSFFLFVKIAPMYAKLAMPNVDYLIVFWVLLKLHR